MNRRLIREPYCESFIIIESTSVRDTSLKRLVFTSVRVSQSVFFLGLFNVRVAVTGVFDNVKLNCIFEGNSFLSNVM